jgi:hypothetical protein
MAQPMRKTDLPDIDVQMFQRGVEKGRDLAIMASRKLAAWAEKSPGQVVLAGLFAGFVIGKLLFHKPAQILDVE